jgi:hypothetical protein
MQGIMEWKNKCKQVSGNERNKNLKETTGGLKKVISKENISAHKYCLYFYKIHRKSRRALISIN